MIIVMINIHITYIYFYVFICDTVWVMWEYSSIYMTYTKYSCATSLMWIVNENFAGLFVETTTINKQLTCNRGP